MTPAPHLFRLLAQLIDTVLALFLQIPLIYGIWCLGANSDSAEWITAILLTLGSIWCWSRFGTSPGKRLFGLCIVPQNGTSKLSWQQAAWRQVGYILTVVFLFIPLLPMFWDKQRRPWHDRLAQTKVVYDPCKTVDIFYWARVRRF